MDSLVAEDLTSPTTEDPPILVNLRPMCFAELWKYEIPVAFQNDRIEIEVGALDLG